MGIVETIIDSAAVVIVFIVMINWWTFWQHGNSLGSIGSYCSSHFVVFLRLCHDYVTVTKIVRESILLNHCSNIVVFIIIIGES